ncbi:MAG: T9SS type A sorting domain-containing protein [Saprospiraceae bacterium]|nr:T9SS type A sorting domain-containing protein [Saprospiraceae bacterium]MBK7738557.1 T9SS type A sorting domain-containing protein [Saprospiraceae bacterium]MBK7912871.1 T9SS type A sorting domain-containing protein [Saprospiraceae bacterium]
MRNLGLAIFLIAISLFDTLQLVSQDSIWPIGIKNEFPIGADTFGTEFLFFKERGTEHFFIKKFINFASCVSAISLDSKLIYFSNGIHIYNKDLDIMENGNDINPGQVQKDFSKEGYPSLNSFFSVLSPGKEKEEVDLIHMQQEYQGGKWKDCIGSFLYHTKIDIHANNGLGRVIFKNKIIGRGPFKRGSLAACRHANGRDWWFAVNPCNDSLQVYLLTPQGPKIHHFDSLKYRLPEAEGQGVFSPDGRFFAINTNNYPLNQSEIHLFDFDRCTGHFSNHRSWHYSDLPQDHTAGVAISANSRFMYIISRLVIHQYDLWAPDIIQSDQVVATYDGFVDLYGPTVFFTAQLAPNNKIYITGRTSLFKLTVIENPDLPGLLCNVNQHSLSLLFQNNFSMPYFPYYRLGAEKNSSCDTLIVANKNNPFKQQLEVYPIPAHDKIYLKYDISDPIIQIELLNLEGITIHIQKDVANREINISSLGPGVYFMKYKTRHNSGVQKILVN